VLVLLRGVDPVRVLVAPRVPRDLGDLAFDPLRPGLRELVVVVERLRLPVLVPALVPAVLLLLLLALVPALVLLIVILAPLFLEHVPRDLREDAARALLGPGREEARGPRVALPVAALVVVVARALLDLVGHPRVPG
jgi:hypothetical protein